MRSDRFCNLYAEAAALGSMILDPCLVPCVLERLVKDDFTDPRHEILFDAIVRVWRHAGKDMDGVLLRAEMDKAGQLAAAGGLEYIDRILDSVPTATNAAFYRDLVAEASRQRRLARTVEAMQKALDQAADSNEAAEQIRAMALAIEDQPRRSVFKAADCAIEAALAIQDEGPGLGTGFRAIDDIVGGFHAGEVVILAARPSVGKTSLALAIAGHVAKNTGVLFITLEMPAARLLQNLAGQWGKVDVHALRKNPQVSPSMDRFQEAALALAKTQLTVIEGCCTTDRMAAAIRAHKQESPLSLVVLDYLGLLRPVTKSRSRYEDTTEISRSLKLLALSENIPILALSQLNREPEGRENYKPRMSDLRDSGAIEQDADAILMIHREDVRRKALDWATPEIDGCAEVAIHKSRNGPTGVAKLVFLEEFMLFADRSEAEEPGAREYKWYEKDEV